MLDAEALESLRRRLQPPEVATQCNAMAFAMDGILEHMDTGRDLLVRLREHGALALAVGASLDHAFLAWAILVLALQTRALLACAPLVLALARAPGLFIVGITAHAY